MIKLIDIYKKLKEESSETIYLFRQGTFLIAISADAITLSNKFGFKLTHFNANTLKCGFPISATPKYLSILENENIPVKIIDNAISYSVSDFSQNQKISDIIDSIKKVDVDNLSVSEAYSFIEDLKNQIDML